MKKITPGTHGDAPCLRERRVDELRTVVAPVADRAIGRPKFHAIGSKGLRQGRRFRIRAMPVSLLRPE
jgi:hypothetical protein